MKNDYVTKASLSSQLNDLKSQHIATEVTAIDNKTKKNANDIFKLRIREDTVNEKMIESLVFLEVFSFIFNEII